MNPAHPLRHGPLQAAIVDLDGTMVDTVGDFHAALTLALDDLGLPPVALDFIARTVGKGSEHLLNRTLAELGADDIIDYVTYPDWDKEVMRLTGGRGADHVMEVGGAGTLPRSLQCLGIGGCVILIGTVSAKGQMLDPNLFRGKGVTLRSLSVGSRQSFESMNRALEQHELRPVVDQVFPFAQAREAFQHLQAQRHFGKVVIGYA